MQSTKRPVSFFFTSIQPSSHGRCKKFSLLVPKYSYFQAAEKLLIKMHRQALCCCCYFRAQGSGKGKCCRYRKPSLTRGREPVVNSWLYICNTEALLTILQQIFVRNEPSFTTQHCTRPTNISKCMAPTKRMIREYSPNL